MKSRLPKVLHPVAGRPLLHHSIAAAVEAGASRVVVVVSEETKSSVDAHVASEFPSTPVVTVVQPSPRGTGDAARVALDASGEDADRVLVLCGDTPLIRASDCAPLVAALGDSASMAVLSCELDDPRGYGRILRDGSGRVTGIVEDRDLSSERRGSLREVNAGVYAARADVLRAGLAGLRNDNAQGEYYLTDVVAHAHSNGGAVAVKGSADALVGVNDRSQLAHAEEALFRRIAERHRLAGVTVRGDARIDDTVTIGEDSTIEAGVRLRGKTKIGASVLVDVGSVLTDATVGEGTKIHPYSVLEECAVGPRALIGPFARVRPGSEIGEEAHVGNFVEAKKTKMGKGAKANHLAYLGDGDIGPGANIGAGTIFCNYDGFTKSVTTIAEGAFIGSDSQLVAPVRIGVGAYVATGTTVTQDVPDDALAISRTKQENKLGYASRIKRRLAAKKK